MFHRHDWRLTGEWFNPPYLGRVKAQFATGYDAAIFAYGFTVVTYQCSRCPARKFDEVVGRTAGAG